MRAFCETLGLTKYPALTELELPEHCVREDLNRLARRVYGVLQPIRVVLVNSPADRVEYVELVNNPEIRPPENARSPSVANCLSIRTISWKITYHFFPVGFRGGGATRVRLLHHLSGSGQRRCGLATVSGR